MDVISHTGKAAERTGNAATEPVLVVFDLDGTLVDRDSLIPFIVTYSVKHYRLWALLILFPTILAYALRLLSAHAAKQMLLRACFRGEARQRVATHASLFARTWLPKHVRKDVVEKLRSHQRADDRVILLSASPDLYLTEVAAWFGIEEVVCTTTTVIEGICEGLICGSNCKGLDKLNSLKRYLGIEHSPPGSVAYGDSPSDSFVMGWVDAGIWV